jgi:hypothetical protein
MNKCLKVDVDQELHKQFKTISASFGLSLKDAVIQSMNVWVELKSRELGLKP